ncbi:MAG: hypothetical protein R3F43_15795 [bacterium]
MDRSLILAALLCASGCAQNIHHRLPESDQPTGSILIRFTEPARNAVITVNGVLVADDAYTERVEVTRVPAGDATVSVLAGGGGQTSVEDTKTVAVHAERQTTVSFRAPEMTGGTAAITAVLVGLLLATGLAMPLIVLATF